MSSDKAHMENMKRIYLSNIRPHWPIPRQEDLLDEAVPDWRSGAIYRDILSRLGVKQERALPERDGVLLRDTARGSEGQQLIVASLSVLAWTPTDLLGVLMRLAARHDRLHAVAEKLEIDPANPDIAVVRAAFSAAVRRFSGAGVSGGEASGRRRMAEAQAKIERIRPFWPLSSADYPTAMLCKREGVSRPTVIQYLGSRRDAQLRHQAGQKIAESNRRRKRRGPEKNC